MPKIPDFSELTKSFNIQGIVDSVKSVINPGSSAIANPPTGDELAAKFAELHGVIQTLANVHTQQAREIANINHKLEALYKDMLALRQANQAPAVEQPTAHSEQAKDEDKD